MLRPKVFCAFCFLSLYNWAPLGRCRLDSESSRNWSQDRHTLWFQKAYAYASDMPCQHYTKAATVQCQLAKKKQQAQVTLYVAETEKRSKLATFDAISGLPLVPVSPKRAHYESSLPPKVDHEAVLVLDPFPDAAYGHLVLVFLIYRANLASCQQRGGLYVDGDCLLPAEKQQCRRVRFRRSTLAEHRRVPCHVELLPLVCRDHEAPDEATASDTATANRQLLRCKEAAGFAPCPEVATYRVRRPSANKSINNDGDRDVWTTARCRLLQICDHAIVLHGGWTAPMSRARDVSLLHENGAFLTRHGFPVENILYHHPYIEIDGISIENENLLNDKSSLRTYVQDVCDSMNCVDVLAVFVHAPAVHTAHGLSLLLGDLDHNGKAEEEETYNLRELLDDLADCQANQVYLILDHSYSGAAVEALASSTRHNNVIAVSSAKAYQSSWEGEFTRAFLEKSEVHDCFDDSFQLAKGLTRHSEATIRYPENWKNDKTMAGAPCHSSPLYNEKILSEKYVGCQNVPTVVWFGGKNPVKASKPDDSIGKQSTTRSKKRLIAQPDQAKAHRS
uniref:Uncharacterized protein n=1 Tax=Trichuris muris TaxID=70415 RepID=A0A5S6QJE6_TRIMR